MVTTTTRESHGIVLWNFVVGWFLTIRPTPHHPCCCCPETTTISTTSTLFGDSNNEINHDDNFNDDCVINAHDCAEDWSSALWWSLKLDFSHSLCSKELKEALFAKDTTHIFTEATALATAPTQAIAIAPTITTNKNEKATKNTNKHKLYLDCENGDGISRKYRGGNSNTSNRHHQQQQEQQQRVHHEISPWIVRGIPERPLYKEVAKRLYEWNRRCFPLPSIHMVSSSKSESILAAFDPNNIGNSCSSTFSRDNANANINLIVPAEDLGFEELPVVSATNHTRLPPRLRGDIPGWLFSGDGDRDCDCDCSGFGGDALIYRLLGIRNTVGSLLPVERRVSLLPSKRVFLEASEAFLPPKQKQRQKQQEENEEKAKETQQLSAKRQKNTRQQITQPHDRLTVAAKARSKHAHRAVRDASFFGIARGPVSKQNKEASEVVRTLLEECVWINCHIFGGLPAATATSISTSKKKTHQNHSDDTKKNNKSNRNNKSSDQRSSWVVEIREQNGYGARWMVEVSSPNEQKDKDSLSTSAAAVALSSKVTFRGFLEPQMKDGHEHNWRH